MQRIVEGYFHLLKLAIVVCLALMVVLVFGNVVLRYALNMGITVSEELSRFLFVWMTFLGAIIAFREPDIWASTWWSAACPRSARRSAWW